MRAVAQLIASGTPTCSIPQPTGALISNTSSLYIAVYHCEAVERLTCICSGSRSCLWKSDQCSSGSCSSRLRTRVVDRAVFELHVDVLVGMWRCVLRHDEGECEGTVSLCSSNRPIPLNKD